MALRLLLVSLVASLGSDWPTSQEVRGWLASGRAWCEAQLAAVSPGTPDRAPGETEAAGVAVSERGPGTDESVPDRAFAAVVDQMAAEFSAPAPRAEAAAVVTFEPYEVGDDLYPGMAYALNRGAEGLSGLIGEIPAESAEAVAVADRTPERVAEPLAAQRKARLEVAVRLTGEALRAWLTCLQGPALAAEEP